MNTTTFLRSSFAKLPFWQRILERVILSFSSQVTVVLPKVMCSAGRQESVAACQKLGGFSPLLFRYLSFSISYWNDVHEDVRGRWERNTQILLINLTKFFKNCVFKRGIWREGLDEFKECHFLPPLQYLRKVDVLCKFI